VVFQEKIMAKTLLQLSLSRESQEAIVIILRNPDAKVDAFQKSQATMIQDIIEQTQVFKVRTLEH
jgi:hypothetical protein